MADTDLVQFGSLTKTETESKIVDATYASFTIIAPWVQEKSDNNAVHEILILLHEEAQRFFVSIAQSYKNADTGYEFAKSAANLCKSLLDPENTNEEIQDLIAEMQTTVRNAHADAKTTSMMFSENRRGFNKVINKVPDAYNSVHSEHEQMQVNKDKMQRRADAWGNMAERLLPMSNKRSRLNSVSGGLTMVKINDEDSNKPPRSPLYVAGTLIALPVTIPFVLVAKSRQSSLEAQAQELSNRVPRFITAVSDLRKVQEKLSQVMENIDIMANYWSEMDIVLRNISKHANELRKNTTFQSKIKSLQEEWNQVGNEYGLYMTQLARLRDLNPSFKAVTEGKSWGI